MPSDMVPEKYRKLEGPSMKIFYQNFQRVRRGEWWVFEQYQDAGVYYQRPAIMGSQSELNVFSYIVFLLSFDFLHFNPPDTETIPPKEICALIKGLDLQQLPVELRMPPRRFLEIYHGFDALYGVQGGEEWWKTVRLSCLRETRSRFRNYHHK